ncbi:MAG TPA: NYN domain-containing protein [Streptosporangiaceae bacterium]|nr:NYN domain-containing protein [Streptosporangiaceae bacterium]
MDRCALFVDAGYALSDGAAAVHGTRHRDSVSWDYAGLLKLLAELSRDRTGLPVLRCYWYEATVDSRRTAEHDTLADIPGLKLRLGKVRPGRREGVETEISRDLSALARNKAVSDVIIVSAEEDLAQVISDVQDQGIRVALVHIATDGDWTIGRALRQECDDIIEIAAGHLRPYVDLIPGAEPSTHDDGSPAGGYGRDRETVSGAGGQPVQQPAGARGLGGLGSLYPAPVAPEYPRTALPIGGAGLGASTANAVGSGAANSGSANLGSVSPGLASGSSSGNAGPGILGQGGASPHGTNPGADNAGLPNTGLPNTGLPTTGAGGTGGQDPNAAQNQRPGQPGQDLGRGVLAGPETGDSGRQGPPPGQSRADDQQTRMPAHPQYQMPEPIRGALPSHGQNGLSQNGLPQNGLPQNGLPQNGLSQNGLSQNGLPQNGLSQNGLPQNGLPQNGLSQNGLSPNGFSPHSHSSQGPAAGEPPRGGGLPQHGQGGQQQNGAPTDSQRPAIPQQRQLPAGPGQQYQPPLSGPYGQPQQPPQPQQQAPYPGNYGPLVPPQAQSYPPQGPGPYGGPQAPGAVQPQPQPLPQSQMSQPISISLADAVQAAHAEGFGFGEAVARDAPALWLEAVLARKPRMPSDLEARLLQGSALPIDSLLHDEVRHALRRGFWDALERSRR